MGRAGGAVVGAGRSQPLRDHASGNLVDQSRASQTAADRSVPALRGAGGNADGSRHAMVEHESGGGMDLADGVDHAARDPAAFQRVSASADARESRALSWSVGRSDEASSPASNPGATVVAR